MMRTVGFYLIVAAVAIRGVFNLEGYPFGGVILALVGLYAILLSLEPWLIRQSQSSASARPQRAGRSLVLVAYLLIQLGLVLGLLVIPPYQDTFLTLLVPLGIQAVLFFGQKAGFVWIAAFPLVAIPFLIIEPETNNIIMVFADTGFAFLAGVYASLIQKAEIARIENERMYTELQAANLQLKGYATQLEGLATEHERNRLARELHDSVTQTVFSMNLTVQSAQMLLGKDPGRAAGQLLRLEELARSAMGEIQILVSELKPRPALQEDLITSVNQLIDERRKRDGLQIYLECSGGRSLTPSVSAGLYNIVQEALTNVKKHAGIKETIVRLNLSTAPAVVEIEDHGVGFDTRLTRSQSGHMGLPGMAERAREIGWVLSVDSQPGSGTRVRVEEKSGES